MDNHTYIVVDKQTQVGVWEFYNPQIVGLINTDRYYVLTALDYLGMINRRLKAKG